MRLAAPFMVAVCSFEAVNMAPGVFRALPAAVLPAVVRRHIEKRPYPDYATVLANVRPDDVVLAIEPVAWPIPTWSGKIVSSLHGQAFIPDETARHHDVAAFFSALASTMERQLIVNRYHVGYILLDDTQPTSGVTAGTLTALATVVRQVGTLTLLRVTPNTSTSGATFRGTRRSDQPLAADNEGEHGGDLEGGASIHSAAHLILGQWTVVPRGQHIEGVE
jgi:hypothetical protein